MATKSKSIFKLINRDGPESNQEFTLSAAQILIGKDPSADRVLSSPGIS